MWTKASYITVTRVVPQFRLLQQSPRGRGEMPVLEVTNHQACGTDAVMQVVARLCATAVPTTVQQQALTEAIGRVSDWSGLVNYVEAQGIAPLAALHLANLDAVPAPVRLALKALRGRHALAHQARVTALAAAVKALNAAHLDHLFMKGVASAALVYPTPELRAMRDVDLLVRDDQLDRVRETLSTAGFAVATTAPPGCHEVFTVDRTDGGFTTRIDVHRRAGLFLLPSYDPAPRQTAEELLPHATTFDLGGEAARAPSRIDILRIVFRHAFATGLYEPFRLVSIADAVTALEAWADTLDWAALREADQEVFAGLAMLHHVVPLSERVRTALGYTSPGVVRAVGQAYRGAFSAGEPYNSTVVDQWKNSGGAAWRFFGGQPETPFGPLVRATWEADWWMRTRHGVRDGSLGWCVSRWRMMRELSVVASHRWSGRGNMRR